MDRRAFLRGAGALVGLVAAEPVRRYWQVGAQLSTGGASSAAMDLGFDREPVWLSSRGGFTYNTGGEAFDLGREKRASVTVRGFDQHGNAITEVVPLGGQTKQSFTGPHTISGPSQRENEGLIVCEAMENESPTKAQTDDVVRDYWRQFHRGKWGHIAREHRRRPGHG